MCERSFWFRIVLVMYIALYNNIFPRFFLYENISVYNRSDCPARLKGKAIHFLSIFWKFVCVFFFFFFSFELLLNEIVMDGCVHVDGMSDLGMFCVWIPCRTDITYYFGWYVMEREWNSFSIVLYMLMHKPNALCWLYSGI